VKKALSNGSRNFNSAFPRAQQLLKDIFGMELVEVMSRAERDAQEKQAMDGTTKKKVATSPKAYVLCSTLDPALIEAANTFDDTIRVRDNNLIQVQMKDSEEIELGSGGCLLAWQFSDRLGSVGLLSVILALIHVSGKELADVQLRGYLKQLRLPPTAKVPFKTQAAEALKNTITTDTFLANMVRQGYLDKSKKVIAPSGSQAANKNKRARAGKGKEQDGNESYNWKWGPRAFVEFGEGAIVDFLTAYMVEKNELLEQAVEEEEDGTPEVYQERRERRREEAETMKRSIMKAAMTPMDDE